MAVRHQNIDSKRVWESFIDGHPEANFLQSWAWGEMHMALGREVIRRGYWRGSELVGVMVAVVEPAKRGRYLAVAGGPILDWKDTEVVSAWRESLAHLGAEQECVFVRVRPQLLSSDQAKEQFQELGFRPAPMHLEAELTSQLDITPDENKLLSQMRKNTRYELKQAKKRDIRVTASQDPASIREFYELQLKTAERHGFVPFSYERLLQEFTVFAVDDQVVLYSAHSAEGQLIAQAFVVFYGAEASYHYGASTELGRSEPGAYAIQWQAIKEAKRRGCTRYNFWGVVRPDETQHRFYGVSVFKRGFRGEDVEYLHAHDLVLNKTKYLKNLAVEHTRRKLRKL